MIGAEAILAKTPAVTARDVVWARPDGLELLACVYDVASRTVPAPVVVDVHGGAWSSGDRLSGALYDAALAQSGLVVVAIDFRMGPDFKHPAASADVAAAVRWVRLRADALRIDARHVGYVGSSSGGHLAMLAGLKPNAPMHFGTPIVDGDNSAKAHDEIDASVDYVVALWPVSDPAARFRYARRAGITRLQDGGNAYFRDEQQQWEAAIPRIVTAGETERLPPLLVVQPGEDSNIPEDMTFDLLRAYQARGGKLDYAYFPGMPHGFGRDPSPAADDLIALMRSFMQRQVAVARHVA